MEMRASSHIQDFTPILQSLSACEEGFRVKILRGLKRDVLNILPHWNLDPVREDYLLHQLNQSWSIDDLLELIGEVNSRHLRQHPQGFYLYLSMDNPGLQWKLLSSSAESLQ